MVVVCFPMQLFAFQENDLWQNNVDTIAIGVNHGPEGFEISTPDKKFLIQIAGRLQFRYAYPNDQDPITFEDFQVDDKHIFKVNRARLKVGGHAYQPWLKYYFEYELSANRLLDFRIMIEKWPWLNFKVGQWKTEYSRERIISSGKQQMMERSIINRPFTLDRQQGVTVYGHLKGPGLANFNYHLFMLTGSGMGIAENDDDNLLYSGRLQWNFFGDGVPMSGSDLEHHEKPLGSLAIAAGTNTSRFTRFSSAGGGALDGFEIGVPGQFTAEQMLIESAFKYRSLSWHSEWHFKSITDNIDHNITQLTGYFVQGGYMVNGSLKRPHPLFEFALRYSRLQPRLTLPNNTEEEFSLSLNCFFNEHLNKLTADVSFFEFESESINREASGWRFRVQYDFSF